MTLVLSFGATPERDEAVVPPQLQAALLSRVLRYDREFASREQRVAVLVVHRESGASEATARQLVAALRSEPALGTAAHDEVLVPFVNLESLVKAIDRHAPRVVVFAPGFADASGPIANALAGRQVLTVSSTPRGIREGFVLGFDLVDGKPSMLFNLASARLQKADFRAEVIKLMKVVP